jgi:hypothetical protein
MLAAAKGDPMKIKDAYAQAIAQGVGVAAGKLGWAR